MKKMGKNNKIKLLEKIIKQNIHIEQQPQQWMNVIIRRLQTIQLNGQHSYGILRK